jgi:cation:H+ antiporter
VFAPYLLVLGLSPVRVSSLRLPRPWTRWLSEAIREEEVELEETVHPRRGRARDAVLALTAGAVVVGASIAMEKSAVKLGRHAGVPAILTGGIMLAAVTSLPNAVAAIYWATRGRGAALLSTALNSNAINVLAGLLLPGTLLGLGSPDGPTVFLAACYFGLTSLALLCALRGRGLSRSDGALIILAYLAILAVLVAIA